MKLKLQEVKRNIAFEKSANSRNLQTMKKPTKLTKLTKPKSHRFRN